jgi:hypothetical protein
MVVHVTNILAVKIVPHPQLVEVLSGLLTVEVLSGPLTVEDLLRRESAVKAIVVPESTV